MDIFLQSMISYTEGKYLHIIIKIKINFFKFVFEVKIMKETG